MYNQNSSCRDSASIRAAVFFIILCLLAACNGRPGISKKNTLNFFADTSGVTKDTLPAEAVRTDKAGILYAGTSTFSGCIKTLYPDSMVSYASVYRGRLHGWYRSYYPNGKPFELHHYKENRSTGHYIVYWENGKMRSDCLYYEDKKTGSYNRWYPSGKPYMMLNYENDKEDGLQQGFTEAGRLFINYIVRNGYKYGLQETAACYQLDSGKIKN